MMDFRFGWRMLIKHRVATLAAVVSLALAIGACSTAFALIDGLLFRPLPLPDPQRLIRMAHILPAFFSPANKPGESDMFSYPMYQAMREAARDDAELFAMSVSGGLQPVLFDDASGSQENVSVDMVS